jgi:hypothetical protein
MGNTYFIWNYLLTAIPELHIPTLSFKSITILDISISMLISLCRPRIVSNKELVILGIAYNITAFIFSVVIYYTLIV